MNGRRTPTSAKCTNTEYRQQVINHIGCRFCPRTCCQLLVLSSAQPPDGTINFSVGRRRSVSRLPVLSVECQLGWAGIGCPLTTDPQPTPPNTQQNMNGGANTSPYLDGAESISGITLAQIQGFQVVLGGKYKNMKM